MLVGFDCYLRIGELMNLTVQDVAMANDPRIGAAYRGVLLRLGKAKTGTNQTVTVESNDVAYLLQRHVRGRKTSEKVFSIGLARVYTLMRQACGAFGLGDTVILLTPFVMVVQLVIFFKVNLLVTSSFVVGGPTRSLFVPTFKVVVPSFF